MSGLFEVLAASPDEEKIAQQQAQDRLAAAVYDVREAYGDFLFRAASIYEFRTRVALIKGSADQEIYKIVDRHLRPVTGVMRHINGRDGVLEKEFRSRQSAEYTEHGPKVHEVRTEDPSGREWSGFFESPERARQWAERREEGGPYDPIPPGGIENIAFQKGAPFAGYKDFAACVAANQDKDNPQAYCGKIKHQVEGAHDHEQLTAAGYDSTQDVTNPRRYRWKPVEGAQYLGWHAIEADGTEGAVDTEETFRPSSGPLIPEGDWPGFQDSVTQPAESKMEDHVFVPGEHDKSYGDTSGADFAPKSSRRRQATEEFQPVQPTGPPVINATDPGQPLYAPPGARGFDESGKVISRRRSAWDEDYGPEGPYTDMSGRESPAFESPRKPTEETHPGWKRDEWGRMVQPEGGTDPYARRQEPGGTYSPLGSTLVLRYLGFCYRNSLPPTLARLERHGKQLSPSDYLKIADALSKLAALPPEDKNRVGQLVRWAETYHGEGDVEDKSGPFAGPHGSFPVGTPKDLNDAKSVCNFPSVKAKNPGACKSVQKRTKPASRRQAAPDYLQKANDALTGLLNQRAEDFQSTIAPLQQALQVVQQSQTIEQAQNPMAVQPPAGTVNVLPDQPQMPGAEMGAGGGSPADQSAPPPAAGDMGMGGPPQMAANRRAGGYPKGQPARGRG